MYNLLDKTRLINKLLQNRSKLMDFDIIAAVLSESVNANCYVIDDKGQILGYKQTTDTLGIKNVIKDNIIPKEYNEILLQVTEAQSNFDKIELFNDNKTNMLYTVIPIIGGGDRFGTLLLEKNNGNFTDEDLILAEYAATVIAMEILRARATQKEEEARQKATVQVAISTLSYSELDAVKHIFKQLDGNEGVLVASKIADNIGITRSVIVNALRKFESAGVIESRSLGMKGTYIKILNNWLLKILEKH